MSKRGFYYVIFTNSKFLSGEGRIAGGRMALVWAVIIAGMLWLCDMAAGSGLVVWGVAVALGGVFGGLGAGL